MKKLLLYIRRIVNLSAREVGLMIHNPIYICCMVVFPLVIIFFFTSLMSTGQPEKLPCGVVDNDNTSVTRAMIRQLDGFKVHVSQGITTMYLKHVKPYSAMRYMVSYISQKEQRLSLFLSDSQRYLSIIVM